MTRRLYTDRK